MGKQNGVRPGGHGNWNGDNAFAVLETSCVRLEKGAAVAERASGVLPPVVVVETAVVLSLVGASLVGGIDDLDRVCAIVLAVSNEMSVVVLAVVSLEGVASDGVRVVDKPSRDS